MKRVAKAFALFVASTTYVWLLFMTASTIAMFFTLKNPDTMKQWLDNSGVYSSIVDEVSKLATIQQKQENSLVQITSEDIRLTAQQVFTPESLQSDMEGVIDGFYGWFKGETAGPEFVVDFSGRQALFAAAMTAKLEQKINELPECESTGRFTIQAFDPFKADCRPKDVDLTEELSSFEKELAESKDILPQVRFTGDDIKIHQGTESVPVATAWPWVPKAYKALIYAPWVIAGLTLIAGLIMILLSTSRRKGARRFAGGLLFTGIILIISGLFLRPAFERLNGWSTQSLGGQASFTQNIVDPLFREMNVTYSQFSIYFGIGYLIPALVTYGILLITRTKKHETDTPEASPDQETAPYLEEEKSVSQPAQTPEPVSPVPDPIPQSSAVEPLPPATPAPRPQTGRVYTRRPPRIQG